MYVRTYVLYVRTSTCLQLQWFGLHSFFLFTNFQPKLKDAELSWLLQWVNGGGIENVHYALNLVHVYQYCSVPSLHIYVVLHSRPTPHLGDYTRVERALAH